MPLRLQIQTLAKRLFKLSIAYGHRCLRNRPSLILSLLWLSVGLNLFLIFIIFYTHKSSLSLPSTPSHSSHLVTVKVHQGDTLGHIFKAYNLSTHTLLNILSDKRSRPYLMHILPEQTMQWSIHNGVLDQLIYPINAYDRLIIIRKKSSSHTFQSYIQHITPQKHRMHRHARIQHSLFEAADHIGIPEKVTLELTRIFDWVIDFTHDIHRGDSFNLLYDSYYIDKKKVRDGHIIAAELTVHGKTTTAIRWPHAQHISSYYTPAGLNVQGYFLRAPVEYTRISSRFSSKRKHPLLHITRAHHGVDFAAPYGTPIRATAHGKIIFKGKQHGYGQVIIIQHHKGYSTLYAHMQRFAHRIHRGSYVQQGQVIGYVGSTGLATGPHVHYEVRIHNTSVNPLTLKFSQGEYLEAKYRTAFRHYSQHIISELHKI